MEAGPLVQGWFLVVYEFITKREGSIHLKHDNNAAKSDDKIGQVFGQNLYFYKEKVVGGETLCLYHSRGYGEVTQKGECTRTPFSETPVPFTTPVQFWGKHPYTTLFKTRTF